MSVAIGSARPSTGLSGTPLLQAIRIRTEPRGDFARFFLRAEQLLFEEGISVQSVEPATLVEVNEANADSWPPLFGAMDHRKQPITAADMSTLVGYDRDGLAVATTAVRRFDYAQTTAYDELTSLRLIFGDRAEEMRAIAEFELTAPSAPRISGQVLYHGGVWVHPRYRKRGFTRIMPKLNRYLALSQRAFDFEIAMASAALLKPHVAKSYSVEASEPYYAYKEHGRKIYDGVFNWSSRDWIISTLRRDLEAMEAADASSSDIGRDEQPAARSA